MRIALTLPRLPLSGVGTSVNYIVRGLAEAGYDVDVVITGHDEVNDLDYARQMGWNLLNLGYGKRFLPDRLDVLVELINNNNYSLIINNTSLEIQLILPCIKSDIYKIAVMRTLNNDAIHHLSINSEYLDTAVGISAEMARVMSETDIIRTRVELIPNCTSVLGGNFPKPSETTKICYVGRLTNVDKNVRILPLIAKSLREYGINYSLDVIGDGPERKKIEKEFNIIASGRIKMRGLLSRSKSVDVMSNCNFVLLPSVSEGLSNVMLEGMALGSVPICSDIENFKWVLGKAADRLQCRLNVAEDYARNISLLSKNKEEYQAIQYYLYKRQKNNFTPERTVQGYIDLIKNINTEQRRKIPEPVSFDQLQIPKEYRRYCTGTWRFLQKAKDLIQRRHGSI